jgi:hypothetical protein
MPNMKNQPISPYESWQASARTKNPEFIFCSLRSHSFHFPTTARISTITPGFAGFRVDGIIQPATL